MRQGRFITRRRGGRRRPGDRPSVGPGDARVLHGRRLQATSPTGHGPGQRVDRRAGRRCACSGTSVGRQLRWHDAAAGRAPTGRGRRATPAARPSAEAASPSTARRQRWTRCTATTSRQGAWSSAPRSRAMPFQHVGLGDTFADAPWAMFSTGVGEADLPAASTRARGTRRRAFSNTPRDGPRHQPHGAAPLSHRVDGDHVRVLRRRQLVATHTVAIEPMRPVISDATPGRRRAVKVDWLSLSAPAAPAGTFTSRVFDAGTAPNITWGDADRGRHRRRAARSRRAPATRPTPDASWSPFQPLVNGTIQSPAGRRYIQYSAA